MLLLKKIKKHYLKKMTVKESLIKAEITFKKANIPSARIDAEVLLSFLLKKGKEWLYINNEKEISKSEENRFEKLIRKRENRIPVAYIIGIKEFYGIDFYVDKNVLIPRPETEKLIDIAFEKIKQQKGKAKITEIGIGSGCISTIIAKKLLENKKDFSILATDISEKALQVANKNLKKYKVKRFIKLSHEDILHTKKQFDFIISNPPYVPINSKLEKEINYEPQIAIFPKNNFLERFISISLAHVRKNGYLFLEIDPSWEKFLKALKINKEIEYIKFEKDLRNLIRYATIKKRP